VLARQSSGERGSTAQLAARKDEIEARNVERQVLSVCSLEGDSIRLQTLRRELHDSGIDVCRDDGCVRQRLTNGPRDDAASGGSLQDPLRPKQPRPQTL
jgi:hypothetical protein